jgi:hypothetical protein
MKRIIAIALFFTLVLGASALAESKSGTMNLIDKAQLNGKELSKGEYKVKWEGTSGDPEVSIVQGKKVLVTATARVEEAAEAASQNAVIMSSDGTIKAIEFAGKKTRLVFGQ